MHITQNAAGVGTCLPPPEFYGRNPSGSQLSAKWYFCTKSDSGDSPAADSDGCAPFRARKAASGSDQSTDKDLFGSGTGLRLDFAKPASAPLPSQEDDEVF